MKSFAFALGLSLVTAGCPKAEVVRNPDMALEKPPLKVARPVPPSFESHPQFPEPWSQTKPAAVPAVTATSGACIPELLDGAPFWTPVASGHTVELCRVEDYEARKATCFVLDADSGVVTSQAPSKAFVSHLGAQGWAAVGEVRRSDDGSTAESCVEGCVPLDLGGMKAGSVGIAGDFAFVGPGEAGDWGKKPDGEALTGPSVRVFNAKTGALHTLIEIGAFESECPDVIGVGDVLYIEFGVCAGPGANAFFFDPRSGGRLAALGGAFHSAPAYGVRPVPLPRERFAFRDQYGLAIYIHSGKDGSLVSSLNLVNMLRPADADSGLDTSPEEGGLVQLADGRLVVTQGDRHRDRVAVLSTDGRQVLKVFELQACQ